MDENVRDGVMTMGLDAPEPDSVHSRTGRVARPSRRIRVAEGFAVIALLAAFVGAMGPANEVRTTYTWPPTTLPGRTPERMWYTPLLLAARVPEHLSAVVPCVRPETLAKRGREPITILATSRNPSSTGVLAVTAEEARLVVSIGQRLVTAHPWPTGAVPPGCTYRLTIADESWSLDGGPGDQHLQGSVSSTPIVNGVFSQVDLAGQNAPSVSIRTRVHDVRPTSRQNLAWTLSALFALVAIGLVFVEGGRSTPNSARGPAGGRWRLRLRGVDVFVVLALGTWLIVEPAFFDDGWAVARQRSFITAGEFSNYFEPYGASLPLGYWHDWLMHWVTDATDQLAFQRLPAIVCLLATWALTRYAFEQTAAQAARARATYWALAVSFVLVAVAWGISLRQESAVALFLAVAIVCAARFAVTGSAAPLALIAAIVPLSLAVHPAGIVVVAPLVAVAPAVYRWIRSAPAAAVALFVSSGALALTLGFVGSDVEQRAIDANAISHGATTGSVGWRNELVRYSVVALTSADDITGYGPPLRRGSVALMLLAAAAVLLRYRRFRSPLASIAAFTLPICLALLIVTPSKWPWHFGALVAPIALGVAASTAVFRRDLDDATSWRPRPLILIALLTAAIGWSWSTRLPWNPLDLVSLDWTPRFEAWLPITAVAILAPAALLSLTWARARRRGEPGFTAPWRSLTWWAPLLAVPLIAFTTAVLVADAARTPGWTPSRANLAAFWGDSDCGIAEDALVPSAESVRPVRALTTTPAQRAEWVPLPPAPGLNRYALGPVGEASASTPWFAVHPNETMALYVSGETEPLDRLLIEWGREDDTGFQTVARSQVQFNTTAEAGAAIPWRLVPIDRRLESHGLTALRVTLVNRGAPSGAIAVTAPVTYTQEPFERRLRAGQTLVIANVATFFPCAEQPPLHNGVVAVPSTLVTTRDSIAPVRYPGTTPFAGLLDLYPVSPLPMLLAEGRLKNLRAFAVDTEIPGAAVAEPESYETVTQ